MTLSDATDKVKQLAQINSGKLDASILFHFDEGTIFLDDTISPTAVSNSSQDAQCTIKMNMANFEKMLNKDLNPMMAFMTGKMKIAGDKGVAMKLASII